MKKNNKATEAGVFWLPQPRIGGGWDLARRGPRLEVGVPILGIVRAPSDGKGWAISAQSWFRGSFVWPDEGDSEADGGFSAGINLGRIMSFSQKQTGSRPNWPPARSYHTLGVTVEATYLVAGDNIDDGTPVQFFAGPTYEYLTFDTLGL